jgi:hypothetical protein
MSRHGTLTTLGRQVWAVAELARTVASISEIPTIFFMLPLRVTTIRVHYHPELANVRVTGMYQTAVWHPTVVTTACLIRRINAILLRCVQRIRTLCHEKLFREEFVGSRVAP